MIEEKINFCIIGKVDNINTFNEVVNLLDNLPNIEPRFKRTSKYWFYITQDHKAAARAGILRKSKCKHQVLDQTGQKNCTYSNGSIGECIKENCPNDTGGY